MKKQRRFILCNRDLKPQGMGEVALRGNLKVTGSNLVLWPNDLY